MGEGEELALESKGCVVSYSSSACGYGECSKIIDGLRNTYWCTTGLYPQVFILTFPNPVIISSVKIRSYLVHVISVEKSSAESPQRFEHLCEKELDITDHCHQVETLHEAKFVARHLRFTVKSGYDHICAVYRVEVQGVQNKSGGNEVKGDEAGGLVTSPIRQVGRNSSLPRANEKAHVLNSFPSIQHTSKSSLLSDGTGRLVGQLPVERGNHLWHEEVEEGEKVVSPTQRINRMESHDSDQSSDDFINH